MKGFKNKMQFALVKAGDDEELNLFAKKKVYNHEGIDEGFYIIIYQMILYQKTLKS